jgi:hypothetical protein
MITGRERIEVLHVVDGKPVARVERVIWDPDDDDEMRGATIIGRARVHFDHGWVDALLVASVKPRSLGARFAVLFERSTGRRIALEVERGGESS